jgi:hypothetical protein
MTAATASIGRPARTRGRLERTLVVLAICLPVPLLALTGLSLPLPATVERLAAALVPWSQTSSVADNEALPSGARGAIVRTSEEARASVAVPVPVAASNPHPRATPDALIEDGGKGGANNNGGPGEGSGSGHGSGSGGGDGSGGGSGSAGGSGGGSGSSGGSGNGGNGGNGGSTTPVDGVVDEVGGTVGSVADGATDAVDGATDTVEDVVDSTGLDETVDSVLPGLGG